MINSARIKPLNKKPVYDGDFVVYWMQASQRCEYNHALNYSIEEADRLNKPVIVYFGLTDIYPEANLRHYYFMIEGLKEFQESLKEMGIKLVLRLESPELGVIQLTNRACMVVVDKGYLRIQRQWRDNVAVRIDCPLIEVESDVVVPVTEASGKEEYSAATIRPKINSKLEDYLVILNQSLPKKHSLNLDLETTDINDIDRLLQKMNIDRTVLPVNEYHGGTIEAKKYLELFLSEHLDVYSDMRSDPGIDHLSKMSPYLHFGQISPIYIALETLSRHSPGVETFLEELVVRRELSMNFVNYNSSYDSLKGIPEWARMTLKEQGADVREYIYDIDTLEQGNTHDTYWNAAQKEMQITGKMHGYMRMYWGKKLIEWTRNAEDAFRIAVYLNNKYELDGRDPNSYAGIAWCFGKHDRPWPAKKYFGNVRSMSTKRLAQRFNMDKYLERINSLEAH